MGNIIIFITTYNRSEELKNTLESLLSDKDFLARNNVQFSVYDDKSDIEHATKNKTICRKYKVAYVIMPKNFGKKGFWRLHKKIFDNLENTKFDYAFSLQDDYTYEENFLTKTLKLLQRLEKENPKTVCLNLQDNRIGQKHWVSGINSNELINIDGVALWKVGWIDCVYLASRRFFKALDFNILPVHKSRWKRNSRKSSGVGEGMSQRIFRSKLNIYQPNIPLTKHIGIISKMGNK